MTLKWYEFDFKGQDKFFIDTWWTGKKSKLRRQSKMFKFKAPRISWNEAYFHVRRSEHEMKRNAVPPRRDYKAVKI